MVKLVLRVLGDQSCTVVPLSNSGWGPHLRAVKTPQITLTPAPKTEPLTARCWPEAFLMTTVE